jgi:hypothetical protein
MDNNIFTNIPRLLRYLGGLAIGSSAILALVEGITSPISALTIVGFLGFIVALVTLGIWSGTVLRESKGGRVSVGLALALVPSFSALLGALFIRDLDYSTYWRIVPAISIETSIILSILSIVMIVPTVVLGFRVLNGEGYKKISTLYLLGSLMILIPFRDVPSAGVMIFLACAIGIYASKTKSLGTLEQRLAKLLLWITPVVLVVRSLGAHPFDVSVHGFGLLVLALVISPIVRSFIEDELIVKPFELLAGLIASQGAYFLTDGIFSYSESLFVTFGVVMGLMVVGVGQFYTFAKREVEDLGLGVVLFAALLSPFSHKMIISCGISMVISVTFVLLSVIRRSKFLLIGGVVAFSLSVLSMLSTVLTEVNFSSWATLGVIGISVILISSLLERNLSAIRAKFIDGYREISSW